MQDSQHDRSFVSDLKDHKIVVESARAAEAKLKILKSWQGKRGTAARILSNSLLGRLDGLPETVCRVSVSAKQVNVVSNDVEIGSRLDDQLAPHAERPRSNSPRA